MSRYPPRRISLLVRNLPLDARPEELRSMFERYGDVRDVYLPRDYHTDRPRGFGFVEFLDGRDAEEALCNLDGVNYGGREISVVLSKESRKTPSEMYSKDRYRRGRHYRSPRRRSYSRSASPYRQRYRSRSHSGGYSRRYDRRSRSPYVRERSRRYYRRSGSPSRHRRESPYSDERRHRNGREDDRRRRISKSPSYERPRRRSRSRSASREPLRERRSTYSSSPRSRSRTPEKDNTPRDDVRREVPDGEKKSSLSPQTGRHDAEDLFHPTASPVRDA